MLRDEIQAHAKNGIKNIVYLNEEEQLRLAEMWLSEQNARITDRIEGEITPRNDRLLMTAQLPMQLIWNEYIEQ